MSKPARGRGATPAARRRRRLRRRSTLSAIRHASLNRLRVGFLLIAMVVSVFAARVVQLQGIDAQLYAEQARALGAVSEVLPAARGTIYDRNGVPLAESLDGLMIVADPTKTAKDAVAIATVLVGDLGLDYIDTVDNLTRKGTHFRYLARRIPSTKARAVVQRLDDLGYKGIDTRRDPVRSYPGRDIAANVLGYTNSDDLPVGGIEGTYDNLLKGKDGHATYDVGGGNRIPLGDNSTVDPKNGKDLRLTLDRDVQWYAQRALRQAIEDSGAASGSAVVMERATGELLAVADFPSYDANERWHRKRDPVGSAAFKNVYEPGSVQKVVTVASLLDAGKVTPLTKITVPEKIESSDRVIRDYFEHGTLRLTMAGVIAKSSNIGTVLAAREMAARQQYRYLRAFGLGSRVGIQGYGNSPGMLAPYHEWMQIEKDNIAFGQGVAVTAVQMAAAVNTIANGGTYVQPSLVQGRVTDVQGRVNGSAVATRRTVVSPEAADQTRQLMEMVVDPAEGTAPKASIPGYRVAGKTGTAQRVDPRCGCYGRDFTVSFAGFAPADDPRFTVYVVIHKPSNGGGGGSTGGPVFRKLMGYVLQKYAVAPTGTAPQRTPVEWTRRGLRPPASLDSVETP